MIDKQFKIPLLSMGIKNFIIENETILKINRRTKRKCCQANEKTYYFQNRPIALLNEDMTKV